MKYTVQTMGIEAFRAEVQRRMPGIETFPAKELKFDTVEDHLGWHEQGDGKLYCAVYVSMGRIVDKENGPQYRSAFAELARTLDLPYIITPNTNVIIADIAPEQKDAVDAILAKHGVVHSDEMTRARKVAHACVALPTCGLSLSESERALPGIMDKIDPVLRELGMENEPILFRMTGCPNGCGRPYNADFGFVGRAPNKYAMLSVAACVEIVLLDWNSRACSVMTSRRRSASSSPPSKLIGRMAKSLPTGLPALALLVKPQHLSSSISSWLSVLQSLQVKKSAPLSKSKLL